MILIVLTGAAVRLTGSGLGCPDWPTCFKGKVSGSMSIHPFIEYSNRMVTGALIVVVGATFLAALFRDQRRRDLVLLSGALVLGVVGDALLGAMFYATTDEFHQTFVPSREGCVRDVIIDSTGAAMGLFALWLLGRWRKYW